MSPPALQPLGQKGKAPPPSHTSVSSLTLASGSGSTPSQSPTVSSSSTFTHHIAGPSSIGDHSMMPGEGGMLLPPRPPQPPPSAVAPPTRPPRKLNRSANQLNRNQACLPCRRRRIKCDAARPHCSSCIRSYRFLARTQPNPERDAKGVQCVYEDSGDLEGDDSEFNLSRTSEDPRASVHRLEARIAELQGALARLTAPPGHVPRHSMYGGPSTGGMGLAIDTTNIGPGTAQHGGPHPTSIRTTAGMPGGSMFGDFHPYVSPHVPLSAGPIMGEAHSGLSNPMMQGGLDFPRLRQQSLDPIAIASHTHSGDLNATDSSLPSTIPPSGLVGMGSESMGSAVGKMVDDDAGKVGGPFLDILWPGWPPRLPTPSLLNHLVHTFFNVVPSISRILHRQTFLARLELPPTHRNFPHTALLHAICAVTARYTAAVHTISVEETVRRTNEEIRGNIRRPQGMSADEEAATQECFGDRHARFTLLEMQIGHVTGRRMLEIAQAQVILAVYYQQHARWIEDWMMVGSMCRLAVPLGLLNDSKGGNARIRNALLDSAIEEWDREERRLTMAFIMTMDVGCSTTSGWTSSLPLDEMMCRLPCSREDFERGTDIPENPQSWYSTDLYTSHPVPDNFILYCKGLHLLGQVLKFKRKTAALDDPFSARDTPLFRKLDSDISAFHFSFPPEMRDPLQSNVDKGVDADLVGAHLIPHVAAIKLHETFADLSNPRDPSAIRILAEARAVLSLVYVLTSTALDLSVVLTANISFTVYFFVAARTFVLFYQRALESRDYGSAKIFLSEIDVFRMAFQALSQKFALGARHSGMIDQMLQACHEELGEPMDDLRAEHVADPNAVRELAYPYTNRPEHLNDPGPVRPSGIRESAVQEHHPVHILFLRPGQSLKDKMDLERGFYSISRASDHSTSASERQQPPTPPLVLNDGGAAWLQHMSPAAAAGATLTTSSPDDMSEGQQVQVTPHMTPQVTPPRLPSQMSLQRPPSQPQQQQVAPPPRSQSQPQPQQQQPVYMHPQQQHHSLQTQPQMHQEQHGMPTQQQLHEHQMLEHQMQEHQLQEQQLHEQHQQQQHQQHHHHHHHHHQQPPHSHPSQPQHRHSASYPIQIHQYSHEQHQQMAPHHTSHRGSM